MAEARKQIATAEALSPQVLESYLVREFADEAGNVSWAAFYKLVAKIMKGELAEAEEEEEEEEGDGDALADDFAGLIV